MVLKKINKKIVAGWTFWLVYMNKIWWGVLFWWDMSTKGHRYKLKQTTQDQVQDSLLVKRRNDNHSPGPVIGELVPSSHQRSELSNAILCIFSRWDQRIGECIPIPDSLEEEATFMSNGSLKCHRVLISTMPSFGDKVICWYTGLPLRPLYSNISLLSFLLFLRDFHFNCPRMPVILPVS